MREMTGNELGEFPDTADGKKQLRAAVKSHLQSLRGRWILCESIGKEIEIRKRGIKETLAFSGDTRKLKILAAIEHLIRVSKPAHPENFREGNNKPKSKDALAYYRMQASPVLEGESISVEIIIEEDVNGLLHYDVLVPKTKTALDSAEVVALISQNNYSWIGVDASLAAYKAESQALLNAV
jgi:Large polyvalent protein-associated domain 3